MADTKKRNMVTAMFRDRLQAEAAWEWLHGQGYTNQEMNVLMSEATKTRYYSDKKGSMGASSHAAEGAVAGGAVGTAVGAGGAAVAVAAGLAAVASATIPGLGLVIAGPVVAALMGGGAGAVAGGLIGGLIGLGIPESNARAYEKALKEGGIVIGVTPHNAKSASAIKDKFRDLHGENVLEV
jgi:hypothetical protein